MSKRQTVMAETKRPVSSQHDEGFLGEGLGNSDNSHGNRASENRAGLMRKRPHLKSIALPAEHGGWGFLLEPMLLGLIAGFSTAGLAFSVVMLGVFLLHHPLKIAAKDRLKGKYNARTRWADRFVIGYGGMALLPLAGLLTSQSVHFWLPMVFAVPLMLLQFSYDLRNQSRGLVAEISGAVALGALVSSIALLDHWTLISSLVLWGMVALRSVPAILYVRARLRLERGKPIAGLSVLVAHGVALLSSLPLTLTGQVPVTGSIALGVLLGRAAWGLSAYRTPTSRPAIIGIREMIYGVGYAVVIGLGYH